MPRTTEWFHRLPEIQAQAEALPPGTLLDRAAVELLFALSGRQATRLLTRLGAHKVGGALLLIREDLLTRLSLLAGQEDARFEQHRRARVEEHLAEARRTTRARSIAIPPRQSDALPAAVQFEQGRLLIDYATPVELLQNLLAVAQWAAEDWVAFEARTRAGTVM